MMGSPKLLRYWRKKLCRFFCVSSLEPWSSRERATSSGVRPCREEEDAAASAVPPVPAGRASSVPLLLMPAAVCLSGYA